MDDTSLDSVADEIECTLKTMATVSSMSVEYSALGDHLRALLELRRKALTKGLIERGLIDA